MDERKAQFETLSIVVDKSEMVTMSKSGVVLSWATVNGIYGETGPRLVYRRSYLLRRACSRRQGGTAATHGVHRLSRDEEGRVQGGQASR